LHTLFGLRCKKSDDALTRTARFQTLYDDADLGGKLRKESYNFTTRRRHNFMDGDLS
jgi:hypothetical protein